MDLRLIAWRSASLGSRSFAPGRNHVMRTVKFVVRYGRYVLTSLATIAFGFNAN
jgi:hypothetical protein